MRDSVPSPRYSPVCNVLRQWKTSLIPIATYRVCRLYDNRLYDNQLYDNRLYDICNSTKKNDNTDYFPFITSFINFLLYINITINSQHSCAGKQ